MLSTAALLIFAACVAYAVHAWRVHRRESREGGRLMGVRYDGHRALNRRRLTSGGAGVMPEQRGSWQHEAPGPSALDLLYEQMDEQRQLRERLRREEEHERGY